MKYLKLFKNHTQYEEYISSETAVIPNVSHCINEVEVHYNPYVPPYAGFCKLTLNDDSVVELEGSGELTNAIISSYKPTLVSAEIGTLCTSIGNYAFYQCYSLTSCIIGSGVTSIGTSAFLGCSGLTSIEIPNSVTSISIGAFDNCTSLTSVTIGSGVTSIGDIAFYQCSGITSITCNAMTAPAIGFDTFEGIKTGGTLTVPSGSSGYDVWMGMGDYYLGKYGWTKVEQ